MLWTYSDDFCRNTNDQLLAFFLFCLFKYVVLPFWRIKNANITETHLLREDVCFILKWPDVWGNVLGLTGVPGRRCECEKPLGMWSSLLLFPSTALFLALLMFKGRGWETTGGTLTPFYEQPDCTLIFFGFMKQICFFTAVLAQ